MVVELVQKCMCTKVQRWCGGGAEMVQSRCRGGEEVIQWFCIGSAAEVVCRGAEELIRRC